ncbi:MAG: transcriptional repressor [Lachnospiraceae bacterium]|nr:transcriptional repressor [Lachnospiraceae bacterium]
MKTKLKRSRQREAILAYLRSTNEHPTADMVYENVRKEIPNISLGTVYRNLNLLVDCEDIIKLTIDGKSDRFDWNLKPHYHVMCTRCGSVMDLKIDPLNHIDVLAESAFEGKISGHSIQFKGLCGKCVKLIDKKNG